MLCLHTYSNTNFAGDSEDQCSTGGYTVFLGTGAISWSSRKQSIVVLSLMESKYIALSEVGHKTMWIQYFLEELDFTSQEPTTIFEDNQGTIAFATNEKMHCHMKHIHNKFHFIKKLIEDKIVHLEYGPTSQMTADIFTKILSPTIYECHTKFLQLAPSMLEGECTNMSTKGSNSTSISA